MAKITPESASKVRPKCYVPVLTAPPLDELIPLILNAPYDFINTQFTDEVLRARKEKHMEKEARKYYAEIVFQVNLYQLVWPHYQLVWPHDDDYNRDWFSLWYEDSDEELSEKIGRVAAIENNIECLEDDNIVTAEDFYILKMSTSHFSPGGRLLEMHRQHRFSLSPQCRKIKYT